MIRVRVPGKVVVAGEYAVLLPEEPCVVAGVARFLEADASAAPAWSVRSGASEWREGEAVPEALAFAVEAIAQVRRKWPAACSRAIETRDGLRDAQGRKLGLGGSAAATVAAAFAAAEGTGATRDELWALCDEVHRRVQGGKGSGADVAASVHGGLLRYLRSPRGAAPMPVHPDVRFVLAWTGASVKTAPRLERFNAFVHEKPDETAAFASDSRAAVDEVARALASGDLEGLRFGFRAAREALHRLERGIGVELETPRLAEAAEIAWREGGAGKLSGAGGGDCAVLVTVGDASAERIARALADSGLEPVRVGLAGGVDVVGS